MQKVTKVSKFSTFPKTFPKILGHFLVILGLKIIIFRPLFSRKVSFFSEILRFLVDFLKKKIESFGSKFFKFKLFRLKIPQKLQIFCQNEAKKAG